MCSMLGMLDGLEAGAQRRVEAFLARIGAILGNKKRRACFAVYTMGLLGSAERKSIEPLALQACTDPALAKAAQDLLLDFISDSTWDDHEVRCEAAEYALAEMTAQEPVQAWSGRYRFPQTRHALGRSAAPVHRLCRQGHQLPGGREPDACDADDASAR